MNQYFINKEKKWFDMKLLVTGGLLILGFSIVFFYGFISGTYEIFPYEEIRDIKRIFVPQTCDLSMEDFPHLSQTDVASLIQIKTKDDIEQKRNAMFKYIWKDNLTYLEPIKIDEDIKDERFETKYIERIDKLTIEMDYGVNSIAYLFFPKSPEEQGKNKNADTLIIYHQGHAGGFADNGKKTIERLLKENYVVLAYSMPLVGQNNQPTTEIPNRGVIKLLTHNHFNYLETYNFSSLKFFLEPVMRSLNYIDEKYSFKEHHMIGLSGGGWTTMVYSAIDPRIGHSYSVSGGYPGYLQQMVVMNHFERNTSGIEQIVNYPEMYVLSSVGENRKSVHILIERDTGWRCGDAYLTYSGDVKNAVNQFEKGVFKTYVDSSIIGHEISNDALDFILKELN